MKKRLGSLQPNNIDNNYSVFPSPAGSTLSVNSILGSASMNKDASPEYLGAPLISNNIKSINKSSSIHTSRYSNKRPPSLKRGVSVKEVFQNNRQNLTLEELYEACTGYMSIQLFSDSN